MSNTVLVETKTPGQKPPANFCLKLSSSRMTVRELLRAYITHQVDSYNQDLIPLAANFESEDEKILNSKVRKPRTPLNSQKECAKAFRAFDSNQIMVLVNEQQISALDESVDVTSDTKLTFFRLIPLAGG